MTVTILVGNALEQLRGVLSASVHMCCSSPPYYGKRDYGVPPSVWGGYEACEHRWGEELLDRSKRSPGTQEGSLTGDGRYQAKACRFEIRSNFCVDCGAWRGALGLEPTPDLYVDHLVMVFEEVRRVLRQDGTLWLNIGDTYATGAGQVGDHPGGGAQGAAWTGRPREDVYHRGSHRATPWSATPEPGATSWAGPRGKKTRALRDGTHAGIHSKIFATNTVDGKSRAGMGPLTQPNRLPLPGLKPKDLIGVPWMTAFALRRAGWWLRGENIWAKPNPMPESISDRCTTSHEQVFLLAKSARYFYDAVAIAEPANYAPGCGWEEEPKGTRGGKRGAPQERAIDPEQSFRAIRATRNKRTVWTISTTPFPGAHFATFPPALVEPCILAGTSARGCCTHCGAPWRRVVRKIFEPQSDVSTDLVARGAGDQKPMDASNGWQGYPRGTTQSETVGWWPSCHCEGLPRLTPYPKKPRKTDEAGLAYWKRACAAVDAHRGRLCATPRAIVCDEPDCGFVLDQNDDKVGTITKTQMRKMSAGIPSASIVQPILRSQVLDGVDRTQEVGQPSGEPQRDGETGARFEPKSDLPRDVPSLSKDIPPSGQCPRCGCGLIWRTPSTKPAVVLDCFGGAGTTAMVADRLQRDSLLVEMNPEYAAMARRRLEQDGGMFARAAE